MKLILLTFLFLGPILFGFGQEKTNKKLVPDFFYGTWTDSTRTGMTLRSDKELLMVEKTPGSGFEDPKSIEGVKWTYNLFLNERPIVIEILCNHCDNKPVPKKIIGHIEVIDNRHIYFTTLDDNGRESEKLILTKY